MDQSFNLAILLLKLITSAIMTRISGRISVELSLGSQKVYLEYSVSFFIDQGCSPLL